MIRILRVLRVKTRNEGPPPPVHPIPNHMTTQGGVGCVVMWFRMGWLGGGGPLGAAGRRFICPGDQSARLGVGKAPAERGGDGRFACTRSRLNESAWTSHRTYYTRRERDDGNVAALLVGADAVHSAASLARRRALALTCFIRTVAKQILVSATKITGG